MVQEVGQIVQLRNELAPSVQIEAGVSTAFGCTIQGQVPEDEVLQLAWDLVRMGVQEVGLSDTTGMAHPKQVHRLFSRLRSEIGEHAGAAHMHNTRGLGLANCLAAWDAGVRTFDSSQGGIGGCPYAPGASGNVVTEDLVFMFEAMGIHTGVDLQKLITSRAVLQSSLPEEALYGMTPEAGLPMGFTYADGRHPDPAHQPSATPVKA
jgi:hydroxymethylglutaryl-CoA lyase